MNATGGRMYWVFLVASFVIMQSFQVAEDWWLRNWARAYEVGSSALASTLSRNASVVEFHGNVTAYFKNHLSAPPREYVEPHLFPMTFASPQLNISNSVNVNYYLTVYALLSLGFIVAIGARMVIQLSGSLEASRTIFTSLLDTLLSAVIRFYDTTPVGRIVNRFSKDIETIDQLISMTAGDLFAYILATITIIGVIAWVTPAFLVAAAVITLIYIFLGVVFIRTSRDLKRIESVTRSPIFQSLGDTLSGSVTIRAFGAENRFKAENLKRIDDANAPFFYLWVANRWLSLRVDIAGALVAFLAGFFIVFGSGPGGFMDAALAGFSMTYALQFTHHVLWVVRFWSISEINFNSVERVQEYLEIPREPPAIIPDNRPDIAWPQNGAISIENFVMRYAPDLPAVLKNLTLKVRPREKIGIVGRTGSGKSTLALSFFRFMEASEGRIIIDDVDISKIGLHDLRSRLTIIPQEPLLFIGTVRSNLDPFSEHTDADLWDALRRVELVGEGASARGGGGGSLDGGNGEPNLDTQVADSGTNFSQGQRQLIGLARASLKRSRALIMDEATASVDFETDTRIQKTIRKDFTESTILCIAHRLRTIIDFDRILVLDHGSLAQFDHPWELIRRDGIFRSMCQRSGEFETLVEMSEIAEKAYGM